MHHYLGKRNRRDSELDPLISHTDGNSDHKLSLEDIWNFIKVPLLAISYCTVSISCVFVNKVILSKSGKYKGFGSVEFLMFLQSMLAIFFFYLFRLLKVIDFPIKISYIALMRIATVNILFVLMTAANAYGIRHLSMPMVALLKNCQVVFVAVLEYFFLHTRPGKLTIASLGLIVFGSICGSITDLEFNFIGYASMIVAILSSSLYFIVIKLAFKEPKIPEFTLVFYNSLFSIPFFVLASIEKGDFKRAFNFTINAPISFWILILMSGFTAAGVNITTFLFLNASTPTTFSVLGVIKKITQTLLGYLLWTAPTNASNVISVCVGVLGGISYSIAKKIEKPVKVTKEEPISEKQNDDNSSLYFSQIASSENYSKEKEDVYLKPLALSQPMTTSPSLNAIHNEGELNMTKIGYSVLADNADMKFPVSVSSPSLFNYHVGKSNNVTSENESSQLNENSMENHTHLQNKE